MSSISRDPSQNQFYQYNPESADLSIDKDKVKEQEEIDPKQAIDAAIQGVAQKSLPNRQVGEERQDPLENHQIPLHAKLREQEVQGKVMAAIEEDLPIAKEKADQEIEPELDDFENYGDLSPEDIALLQDEEALLKELAADEASVENITKTVQAQKEQRSIAVQNSKSEEDDIGKIDASIKKIEAVVKNTTGIVDNSVQKRTEASAGITEELTILEREVEQDFSKMKISDLYKLEFNHLLGGKVISYEDIQTQIQHFKERIAEQTDPSKPRITQQEIDSLKELRHALQILVRYNEKTGKIEVLAHEDARHPFAHGEHAEVDIGGRRVRGRADVRPMSAAQHAEIQDIHAPLIAMLTALLLQLQTLQKKEKSQPKEKAPPTEAPATSKTREAANSEKVNAKKINKWLNDTLKAALAGFNGPDLKEWNERTLQSFREQLDKLKDIEREGIKKEIRNDARLKGEIAKVQREIARVEKPETLSMFNIFVQELYNMLEPSKL